MPRRRRPRRRTQRPGPEQRAPRRQRAFFGYPSHPPALAETIDGAIRDLNGSAQLKESGLRIRPWPELSISGNRLIDQITQAIDRSDVVAFDVTYQNANVAFEMGYAIGTFKRIWLSLDTSIQNATLNFKNLYTGMLGAGYAPYENRGELANAFLRDKPWNSLDESLLADVYRNRTPQSEHPTLLYVKPRFDTDAVVDIRERIQQSPFSSSYVIDDPRENAGASLEWYADHITQGDAVLVHLLSDNNVDSQYYNAKASFVGYDSLNWPHLGPVQTVIPKRARRAGVNDHLPVQPHGEALVGSRGGSNAGAGGGAGRTKRTPWTGPATLRTCISAPASWLG